MIYAWSPVFINIYDQSMKYGKQTRACIFKLTTLAENKIATP